MKEKKEKRRWGLMIFIILIMVGTSFGAYLSFAPDSTQNVRYKNFVFGYNGKYWIAKINGQQAAFSYQPKDVEDIYVSPEIKDLLPNKLEIDTTSEYNSTAKQQIAYAQQNMGLTLTNYKVYLRQGFTENNPFKFPIINCSAATQAVPIIYFTLSNETKIFTEGKCVIAQSSKPGEVERVKDRILYSILGVI